MGSWLVLRILVRVDLKVMVRVYCIFLKGQLYPHHQSHFSDTHGIFVAGGLTFRQRCNQRILLHQWPVLSLSTYIYIYIYTKPLATMEVYAKYTPYVVNSGRERERERENQTTQPPTANSTTNVSAVANFNHPIPEHVWKKEKNPNCKTLQKHSLSRSPKNSWRLHKKQNLLLKQLKRKQKMRKLSRNNFQTTPIRTSRLIKIHTRNKNHTIKTLHKQYKR